MLPSRILYLRYNGAAEPLSTPHEGPNGGIAR